MAPPSVGKILLPVGHQLPDLFVALGLSFPV